MYILLYSYRTPRDLHSFPTRRSSDLHECNVERRPRERRDCDPGGRPKARPRGRRPAARRDGEIRRRRRSAVGGHARVRSEEHTSELQSPYDLVCRLLLEKKKKNTTKN